MGLSLLFGSLPGPWLTLLLPAGAAFALHDRRRWARWAGAAVVAAIAALTLSSAVGAALFGAAVLAIGATTTTVARRPLELGATAAPSILAAVVALAIGRLASPAGFAAWEKGIGDAILEGGRRAVAAYRTLGIDPATLSALQSATDATAHWVVRLWPGLTLLALWPGAWLGYRLLGTRGRIGPGLAERLEGRPFARFRLGEPMVWVLIASLAGLWAPAAGVRRLAENGLLVSGTAYAIQGFAVFDWALARRGWGTLARWVVSGLALALLTPIALIGGLAAGLAEHWLALRERADASESKRDG